MDTLPLVVTLVKDSFPLDVGLDSEASSTLISGLESLQDGSHGWNAIVRPSLRFHDLKLESLTTVVVSVPQFYEVSQTGLEPAPLAPAAP